MGGFQNVESLGLPVQFERGPNKQTNIHTNTTGEGVMDSQWLLRVLVAYRSVVIAA